MEDTRRTLADAGVTLVLGALGAGLFWLIGFPAALLTGPAAAVSVATLMGVRSAIPTPLRDLAFLVIGVSIGSTVTPDVIAAAAAWPLSLAVLALALVATMACTRALLIRLFAYAPLTALLAAAPGHMSYVVGLSADTKADVATVSLVQSVRVLLLTLLVPILIVVWGAEGTTTSEAHALLEITPALILFALAAITGTLFKRLKVPAPLLLGAMAVSAIGHGTSLTPGALPSWLTAAAFVVMGALIGTRFRGIDRRGIGGALLAGLITTLIACALAGLAAWVASGLVGLPPAALLLAFAPGGVEVMAAISVETGLEPAFVAAHHVFRLLILSVIIPIAIVWQRGR